jgi:ATP-dependent DNA helicase RecG
MQEIIQNYNITIVELHQKVNINIRNVKNNIAKLKNMGLLERIGDNKNGYWKILKQKEE